MTDLFEEFQNAELTGLITKRIHAIEPSQRLVFMHVCGTHENSIARYGMRRLLPDWLKVIAGPGCPVCVCPSSDIKSAVELALNKHVTLATFGDMLNVPAEVSLGEARARGGDVRVIYSAADAVAFARENANQEVVLFAIGFETTACTIAAIARDEPPRNFSLLSSMRLIPPALEALTQLNGLSIDGFVLPGHVLTVTGLSDYETFCQKRQQPAVVAGFEPVDIMLGLERLIKLAITGECGVQNAYPRAVRKEGNPLARSIIDEVFEPIDAAWRGLGTIPKSGLGLRERFMRLDARKRFNLKTYAVDEPQASECLCDRVMVGLSEPEHCKLFARACAPDNPFGPCMVSSEGTCRNRFLFREFEDEI